LLLVACAVLLAAFLAFRIWVAAQLDFDAINTLLASGGFAFVKNLLPVPLEVIASPTGRIAFGYEEFPVIVLTCLWTITRGSECLAGRLQEGTMEMLLAQPLSRASIVSSHSLVTLLGVLLLAVASLVGTGVGMGISAFDDPPPITRFSYAACNLGGLGVLLMGGATLASGLAGSRSRAVAIVVGLLVVQLTMLLVGRLNPGMQWLEGWTLLSRYDPTALTFGMAADPASFRAELWAALATLYGTGIAMWSAALAWFCLRDVPAPV
jgi:ABC-2 type transport system permease protein